MSTGCPMRWTSTTSILCALAALVVLSGLSSLCRAADLPPDVLEASRRHYHSGATFYKQGKYAEAHVEFIAAYRLSRLPDLLFNLGRVAEKMGQPGEAAEYLDRYLREKPDAPDRREVEAEVERLRKEAGPPPAPQAPPVTPPVTPPEPQALPGPSPPPRRTGPTLPPWPILSLLGGGAALLVVGIGLGGGALATARQVEAAERFDPALDSRGRSLQGAAIFFDVVGALALAGGAAWTTAWFLKLRKEQALRKETLRLQTTGTGMALSGRF